MPMVLPILYTSLTLASVLSFRLQYAPCNLMLQVCTT